MTTVDISPLNRWRRPTRGDASAESLGRTFGRAVEPVDFKDEEKDVWAKLRGSMFKGKDVYNRNRKVTVVENSEPNKRKVSDSVDQESVPDTEESFHSVTSKEENSEAPESCRIIGDESTGFCRTFNPLPNGQEKGDKKTKRRKRSKKKSKSLAKRLLSRQDSDKNDALPILIVSSESFLDHSWGDFGSMQNVKGTILDTLDLEPEVSTLPNTLVKGTFGGELGIDQSSSENESWKRPAVEPLDCFTKFESDSGLPMSNTWEELLEFSSKEVEGQTRALKFEDYDPTLLHEILGGSAKIDENTRDCEDENDPNIQASDKGSFMEQFNETVRSNKEAETRIPVTQDEGNSISKITDTCSTAKESFRIGESLETAPITDDSEDSTDKTESASDKGSFMEQSNEMARSNKEAETRRPVTEDDGSSISKITDTCSTAKESFRKGESLETAPITDDSEDSTDKTESRVRLIRFADELGLPMEQVHHLDENDIVLGHLVVLFLSPENKKFEFAHAEYEIRAETSVSDLLEQLPRMITSELFSEMEYESLYRTQGGGDANKLETSSLLSDCGLEKNEIAVAVMKGHSAEELVKCATPLLSHERVMKAVKRARRSGRGLKYIKGRKERDDEIAATKRRLEERIIDPSFSGSSDSDTTANSQTMQESDTEPESDTMPELPADEYFELPNLDDEAPENTTLPPSGKMVQLLHAGLVATIGVLYSMSIAQ